MSPDVFPYANTITVIGVVLNIPHLVILARLNSIGGHYKVFLYTVTIADCIMLTLRVCFFNDYTQEFFATHRLACGISAVLANAHAIGVFSTLTLGATDRWKALTTRTYKLLWYVRNFKLLVIMIWMVAILLPGLLAGIYYDKAFTPYGLGVCKLSSKELPFLEPGLYVGVVFFPVQTVMFGLILYKARIGFTMSRQSHRMKQQLTALAICLLLLQWVCWLPVLLMALCRVANVPFSEDAAQLIFTCNPVLNPLAYGISLRSYKQEIKSFLCKKGKRVSTSNDIESAPKKPNRSSAVDFAATIATDCDQESDHHDPRGKSNVS